MAKRKVSFRARLKRRFRRLRRSKRARRWFWRGALVLVLAPVLTVAVMRFVPPLVTPLMVLRLFEGEGLHKDWVPLEEISPHLADAVIAAEDNRFCEHGGFDWEAIKLAVEEFQEGERLRGASTISMQTAKNVFLWDGRNFLRKGLEVPFTFLIELFWDKRRIIEVYLNVVEMGPGVYGAEAAAQEFFGKPAAKLTQREAAVLAAVLPAPRQRSAKEPSSRVRQRAGVIVKRIGQLGPMLDCAKE